MDVIISLIILVVWIVLVKLSNSFKVGTKGLICLVTAIIMGLLGFPLVLSRFYRLAYNKLDRFIEWLYTKLHIIPVGHPFSNSFIEKH